MSLQVYFPYFCDFLSFEPITEIVWVRKKMKRKHGKILLTYSFKYICQKATIILKAVFRIPWMTCQLNLTYFWRDWTLLMSLEKVHLSPFKIKRVHLVIEVLWLPYTKITACICKYICIRMFVSVLFEVADNKDTNQATTQTSAHT